MRIFNAFQIVVLFIAMPFIIAYLQAAEFPCATAVKWVCIVIYIVGFFCTVAAWADLIKEVA